jgi:hypothetical protein
MKGFIRGEDKAGLWPDMGSEISELAAQCAVKLQDVSDIERALFIEEQCAALLKRRPNVHPTKVCLYFGLAVGSALERVESHLIDVSGMVP